MLSLSIDDKLAQQLASLLASAGEGGNAFFRLIDYVSGPVCCATHTLGLKVDTRFDAPDDEKTVIKGIPFVTDAAFRGEQGTSFTVKLDGNMVVLEP